MPAEVDNTQNTTKLFRFSFPTCTNEEILFKLEVPVEIPHKGLTRELVQRVLNMFHIPVYLEDELNEKLAEFVSDETKKFHNERDEKLINQLKTSELNVEGIVKNWEKLFKENVFEFAEQKGTSDEEIFAAAYHKLVHSPALETILQVESSYAKTFMELRKNRDEDIKQLTARQTEEMEEKISKLNQEFDQAIEEEINELAAKHFEEQALVTGRWDSQLDALWQTQRTQFRTWIMNTLDEYQSTAALNTPSNSPLGTFSTGLPAAPHPGSSSAPSTARLEESFTIHLGSQLKQTHNIRIVAADLMDLANTDYTDMAGSPAGAGAGAGAGRRLGGALALYSSELVGAVCVGAGAPHRAAPHTAALRAAAAAAADHHFPHVDLQLRDVAAAARRPIEERYERRLKEGAGGGGTGAGGGAASRNRRAPAPGDVFITRHSNLPDFHVIFHLIVDDSLRSDITSRHPAILGLRNILKAACSNDVTSVALPLLLSHDYTEEMTVGWCLRRAELVLKCAKGFVLELAGAGGAELRTLTLALPARTPPPVFAALAALLPALFRLSTPLRLRT